MGLFNRKQTTQAPAPSAPAIVQTTDQSAGGRAIKHHATVADGIKTSFAVLVGGVAPFVIAFILTISAGYYFNGMRGLSTSIESLIAYGTALVIEAVNLALFFVSAKAFWQGKRAHFVAALVCGALLSVVSAIAQVLYLSTHVNAANLQQGANILQSIPLLGALASTAGIVLIRAIALHIGEFACCYVIARSSVAHRKVIQQMQEEQEAELALLEQAQYAAFKRALHRAQMVQLDAVTAQLGQLAEARGVTPANDVTNFRTIANGNGNHRTRARTN